MNHSLWVRIVFDSTRKIKRIKFLYSFFLFKNFHYKLTKTVLSIVQLTSHALPLASYSVAVPDLDTRQNESFHKVAYKSQQSH